MKANDVLDCYLYGHLYDVYHGDVRDHDPCVNHGLYDHHDHDHNDGLDMHDVCGLDVYRNDVDHACSDVFYICNGVDHDNHNHDDAYSDASCVCSGVFCACSGDHNDHVRIPGHACALGHNFDRSRCSQLVCSMENRYSLRFHRHLWLAMEPLQLIAVSLLELIEAFSLYSSFSPLNIFAIDTPYNALPSHKVDVNHKLF